MPRGYPQGTLFDGVTSFSGGVNSGMSPLLLEPNQLSFATNCTVRGGFVSHRPPYQKLTLDFGGDEDLQAAVEEGLFQGAMVYRPDAGNHLVISSISGRLFQFTVSGTTATIVEITPENDPNTPTARQVWMWQSEKYVIVNDGINLPVIFDGVVSRRSFGDSRELAVTAADFTPPAIGSTVLITLAEVYAGPFDVPVYINGAFYQPLRNPAEGTAYDVDLINLTATPGGVVPGGSSVIIDPKRVGILKAVTGVSQSINPPTVRTTFRLTLTSVSGLIIGDILNVPGFKTAPENAGWPAVQFSYQASHPIQQISSYNAFVLSVNNNLKVSSVDSVNKTVTVFNDITTTPRPSFFG